MSNGRRVMVSQQQEESTEDDGVAAALDSEYVSIFQQYVLAHHGADLDQLLVEEDDSLHYAVQIYYAELFESSPALASLIYLHPRKLLPLFDAAIVVAQSDVFSNHKRPDDMSVKENVHARIVMHGSAADCLEVFPRICRIRCKDLGRLITVKGTVIRTGTVKMLEAEREYECAKCQHKFRASPELEQGNVVQLPGQCPSQGTNRCKGTRFRLVEGSVRCRDYQEVKIQEQVQALGMGSVPRSIPVILEDDLVDVIKAGDDVAITGILLTRWRSAAVDVRCDVELVFKANNVRKLNESKSVVDISDEMIDQFGKFWEKHAGCPMKGRNDILQGICPQVFGLFTVKLAVALTLIGGVPRVDGSGTRIRGESHLLLVGDPGTGKSQFLKYAARLSHRSVMTTGLGSTTAGLTVAARKDGAEWVLEAGALVLGDGGLCCIDEFGSIGEPDRAAIHEAMEQQTISVAKAGLVTTLNTRTTVFAVTNPKGTYDSNQSLAVNCALSGPLLSRFDIVLVLLDTNDAEWDKIVSSHILSEHLRGGGNSDSNSNSNSNYNYNYNSHSNLFEEDRADRGSDGGGRGSAARDGGGALWRIERLRSYICYIRSAFQPVLTEDAELVISGYYHLQRRDAAQNAARTTIRLLESLIRLAHAHARLMFRNEVIRVDAVMAIICVESSMTTSAILDDCGNALHSEFKNDPDASYAAQEALILERLGLRCGNAGGLFYDDDNADDGGQGIEDNDAPAVDELAPARWKRPRPNDDDDDDNAEEEDGNGRRGRSATAGGRGAYWRGGGGGIGGKGGAFGFGCQNRNPGSQGRGN